MARRYAELFPWVDVDAILIAMRILAADAALRQAMARFIAPQDYGLSSPRFQVVRALYLARGHRMSLGEIARTIRVTSTNVTSLVDGLEREGWVVRVASPADRRVTYAQLTDKAVKNCNELIPAAARFTESILSVLSPSEKTELNRLLTKLQIAAERHLSLS